ncbi:MAG: YncE family protein, partial [Burkholderiales bacterium]
MNNKYFQAAAALLLTASIAACAAPFAYVANEESGTLSVIDTATDQVVREIPAGRKPRGMALSKDGKLIYVSDQPNNALDIIDIEKGETVGTVALGESPEGIGISPDGMWVIAAVEVSNSIAFI